MSTQFIKVIGEGSQARIEQHLYHDRIVAVKIYTHMNSSLLRELHVFQRLKDCSNINQMLDIDMQFNTINLIMPYYTQDLSMFISTTSISDRIHRGVNIFNQLLNALYHLHSRNIIHCDIKPENILINDHVVLADFGLSSEGEQCYIRGSYLYYAPELLLKHPYTNKVDIWALGITMVGYYTNTYITDPSIALHALCPGDNAKVVSLQILSLVTNPNTDYLSINQQHDSINIYKLFFNHIEVLNHIEYHIVKKLTRMLQLNPDNRASINQLYIGQYQEPVIKIKPRSNQIDYAIIDNMINTCKSYPLSPIVCYRSIDLLLRTDNPLYYLSCIWLINKLHDNIDLPISNMDEIILTATMILKMMNYILIDYDDPIVNVENLDYPYLGIYFKQ